MIEIPRNTILTSEEATHGFQTVLAAFMNEHKVESIAEVSEHYQISSDWDLIITCRHNNNTLKVCINNEDWVPAINV